MKKIIWITGVVLGIGGAWTGCTEEKEGDLHEAYRSRAVMAENETENFLSGELNLESMDELHEHTRNHLKQMRDLRTTMMDHCRELEGCPRDGGATGHMSGGMMHGGGFLDSEHMEEMASHEAQAEMILGEMAETCGQIHEDTTGCLMEYGGRLEVAFSGMADRCEEMMDDHM